jgi:hypothetical protein
VLRCGIANQLKQRKVYTALQYTVYAELVLGFVAVGASVVEPFFDLGTGFEAFRIGINDYALQPTLALYALTFCIVCTCLCVFMTCG